MKSYRQFRKISKSFQQQEDAPVNNAGNGHVAGIAPGEAPPIRTIQFKKNRLLKLLRRRGGKY